MLAGRCVLWRDTGPGLFPLPIKELEGRRRRSLEISGRLAEPSYDARKIEVSSWGSLIKEITNRLKQKLKDNLFIRV